MSMIPTGLRGLDECHGGILPGTITDIFGASGSGKTQLLFQLSVNSLKSGGRVLYVDTTGGFRPERIVKLLQGSDQDPDLLRRITVSRVTNAFDQIQTLGMLENHDFSFLAIDSVTDLFSFEYRRDESILEKNLLFMRYMRTLSRIAISKKIPVAVTNMIRSAGGSEVENMRSAISPFTHVRVHLFKKPEERTGGRLWIGHASWIGHSKIFSYGISDSGLH